MLKREKTISAFILLVFLGVISNAAVYLKHVNGAENIITSYVEYYETLPGENYEQVFADGDIPEEFYYLFGDGAGELFSGGFFPPDYLDAPGEYATPGENPGSSYCGLTTYAGNPYRPQVSEQPLADGGTVPPLNPAPGAQPSVQERNPPPPVAQQTNPPQSNAAAHPVTTGPQNPAAAAIPGQTPATANPSGNAPPRETAAPPDIPVKPPVNNNKQDNNARAPAPQTEPSVQTEPSGRLATVPQTVPSQQPLPVSPPPPAEAVEKPAGTAPPGQKALININTASSSELQALKGIGPVKAEAIIAYRETNGKFENPEDIINVKGIGAKTLENIIDLIIT